MPNPTETKYLQAVLDRASTFVRQGSLIGVVATLFQAVLKDPSVAETRAMLQRALARAEDKAGFAAFLRECEALEPSINERYAAIRADVDARMAQRARLPGVGNASRAYHHCLICKSLLTGAEAKLLRALMAVLADHFGRLAAVEVYGGDYPTTTFADDVFSTTLGGRSVRIRQVSEVTRQQSLLFFMLEPGLVRWISTFTPDDVFLDVGANIGKYSMLAAAVRGAPTHAVEPFSVNFDALNDAVDINRLQGLVTTHRLALSDVTEIGGMTDAPQQAGIAGQTFFANAEAAGKERSETVQGARLDDLIADGTVPMPTRIKIDVDGAEWRLISGMAETLHDRRLIGLRVEMQASHENQAAVRAIEDAGFRAASDDDRKNLLFVRL